MAGGMSEPEYLLWMKGISKYFPGVQALDNVELRVRAGTVHSLMGENGAGKSTLMKVLFGMYKKDAGEILLHGQPVDFTNPRQALDHGVSMVHQELNQVLERSVMENIWLGRFPQRGLVVDEKEMYRRSREIFDHLAIDIDPRQKMGSLSVSERQMVEIARAVSSDAKIIVLDEPTSSLTEKEVEHLFRIIRSLKERGCGIVYISHKIEEILRISDEVTVMRDGRWVATQKAGNLTRDRIISLMVGRDLTHLFPPKENASQDRVLLAVRKLKGTYRPTVVDVSFDLHEGEILGVAGLMGSRRTEMVETLFGIRRRESGEIYVRGQRVENLNSRQSIANGFALLTEERRRTGVYSELDIAFNATIASIGRYCSSIGVVDGRRITHDTQWTIDSLKVKTPSQKTHIGNLSGGNQQKVVLGRWILTQADILMLDEPTKGIDVGAKYEIYQLMINIAKEGKGILFISSEMPELLGVSDRILVMSDGRVSGIVEARKTSQEEILSLAARFL